MPVCIECAAPSPTLFVEYASKAIRLTQCTQCRMFADPHVEHDFVMITIDLLLHKLQVYRHLLLNRLPNKSNGFELNIMKLGALLTLFDVYVKWFRLERLHGKADFPYRDMPTHIQYLYLLSQCIIEVAAVHLGVIATTRLFVSNSNNFLISLALMLSSFGKLLFILMVIWDYQDLEYNWLVNIIVITSNAQAMSALHNINMFRALLLAIMGSICRLLVQLQIQRFDPYEQISFL